MPATARRKTSGCRRVGEGRLRGIGAPKNCRRRWSVVREVGANGGPRMNGATAGVAGPAGGSFLGRGVRAVPPTGRRGGKASRGTPAAWACAPTPRAHSGPARRGSVAAGGVKGSVVREVARSVTAECPPGYGAAGPGHEEARLTEGWA